uniref:Leucine-rich repeat-containing N-terminal plant-type domain-containing protein n=1 Tax=Ditylum brightwellii TaxID=49249 RepID=A0A7S4VC58_9STRA|mmetsp:Transcript_11125/g.16344  ORF Transcript_11125/g.16344 Transcript_11125/m.16344 type:complete len:545 (-) Transcript_11125:121-1755(-)
MRKSASLEFRTSQSPLDLNNDDGFDFPGTILPNKYEVLSMPHMEERKCCNCFYCTPMLKLLDWMEPSACRRWGVVLCMISTGVVAGVLIGLFAPSWGPAASMNSNSGGNESNDATINDTTAVTQGNESGSNGTVGMIPSSMPSPSILPSNTSYAPSPFDMASLPTLQQGPPPPLLDRKDALLSLLLQSSKVPSQSLSYAQYQATMWMIQDDPLYLNPNTNQTQYIIERYVLVLLYMSMGGIGKSNGGQWVNSAGFLSELTTCDWMGVTCKEDGIVIEMIIFENNGLSSSIPPELSLLSSLKHLDLNNNDITGIIPSEIGLLQHLNYINLSHNDFKNEIPNSLFNCSKLQYIDLSNNNLVGSISSNIGSLLDLTSIALSNNVLVGSVPREIGNLSFLESLSLHENYLSGPIPPEIYNATSLRSIRLFKNTLNGSINDNIKHLVNLSQLLIQNNNLSGTIPSVIGQLEQLEFLYINHNEFQGTIPNAIGNLVNLRALYMHSNFLQGNVSSSICNLREVFLENMWADCKGTSPSVVCECCTKCFGES